MFETQEEVFFCRTFVIRALVAAVVKGKKGRDTWLLPLLPDCSLPPQPEARGPEEEEEKTMQEEKRRIRRIQEKRGG